MHMHTTAHIGSHDTGASLGLPLAIVNSILEQPVDGLLGGLGKRCEAELMNENRYAPLTQWNSVDLCHNGFSK